MRSPTQSSCRVGLLLCMTDYCCPIKVDLKVKMVGEMEFFFSIDADYTQVKGFGVPKRGFCESKGQNGWLKSPLLSCLCYLWVFEKTNMNHKNARSALALS